MASADDVRHVRVPAGGVELAADLALPEGARGVVAFAHGSGSGRHSPRNRRVAAGLRAGGLGTLLLDLLTEDEERVDARTREVRFDIDLLATRLDGSVAWLRELPETARSPVGLFGASTGAAAALVAAARRPQDVAAVVSRGGRPDLAGDDLPRVRAPTLLVVGAADTRVLELNEAAAGAMRVPPTLRTVPNAGHLFEEPGALDRVVELARDWFERHLRAPGGGMGPAGEAPA